MNLPGLLDKNFKGQKRILLGKMVDAIAGGTLIPRGTFVVMASGDRRIRAKILEKDTPNRGFSIPLRLNGLATENKITPRYLLWFFGQDFIKEYLLLSATGAVFLRVPRKVLYDLPIPIPMGVTKSSAASEIVTEYKSGEFSTQLEAFYSDYVFNVTNEKYHTALILAGAIAEMLVFKSLIEHGVDPKFLEEERAGLDKMLTYLKLLRLDKEIPVAQLHELRKKRNQAVHAGSLVQLRTRFQKTDLQPFNRIIRHYGI